MDRKTVTTTEDHHQVLECQNVSFQALASRHSREIRVPRETFYEFVDKTIDRFAETSKHLRDTSTVLRLMSYPTVR